MTSFETYFLIESLCMGVGDRLVRHGARDWKIEADVTLLMSVIQKLGLQPGAVMPAYNPRYLGS